MDDDSSDGDSMLIVDKATYEVKGKGNISSKMQIARSWISKMSNMS
jgi:hypothetical protein